jgi:hypothetical protein
MNRTVVTAALLVVLAIPTLASAAMMKCDDAAMMKAQDHAKMMKGNSMTMAMKEVDMAKMSMKNGKSKDCVKHLDKAMKTM